MGKADSIPGKEEEGLLYHNEGTDGMELRTYTIRGPGGKVGYLEENRSRGPRNGDQIGA